MKDWLPIVVSLASLGIALFTLYRVELRGPSVKFKWLRAPAKWDASGGFFVDEYRSDGQGGRIPVNQKCRVQASGYFEAIIENFGPRTGVLYGTTLVLQNLPEAFDVIFAAYETNPITIDGRTTIALVPVVTLDIVTKDATEALAAFNGLSDLDIRAEYQASRSFGRMLKDHDAISASKQPIIEAVEAWVKKSASSSS
jgi:hypothetical protein